VKIGGLNEQISQAQQHIEDSNKEQDQREKEERDRQQMIDTKVQTLHQPMLTDQDQTTSSSDYQQPAANSGTVQQ
jgi:hypothetical protein